MCCFLMLHIATECEKGQGIFSFSFPYGSAYGEGAHDWEPGKYVSNFCEGDFVEC